MHTCAGERVVARVLSEDDKLRRVVLKRVNLDNAGVRRDFLKSGTMARGAAETGKVRNTQNLGNVLLLFTPWRPRCSIQGCRVRVLYGFDKYGVCSAWTNTLACS